jgi:hypothetical protein
VEGLRLRGRKKQRTKAYRYVNARKEIKINDSRNIDT